MTVSKDEIIHISKLANLNLKEDEIEKYILNLEEILNYVNIIDKAPIEDLNEAVTGVDEVNVFRKDEIKEFDNKEGLTSNTKHIQNNMFKIPKVIN